MTALHTIVFIVPSRETISQFVFAVFYLLSFMDSGIPGLEGGLPALRSDRPMQDHQSKTS